VGCLFVSTALTGALSLAFGQAALAQTEGSTAAARNAAADATADLLADVVVTATRQADTVSRVPLSITAVSQQALDRQGIQNVGDLSRLVPSLNTTSTGGVSQFTIRGITAGGSGAATTGVYLDDTPLTKRNQTGSANNNGTPAPPLFDIERVEVLRGPQGTLYGGSSEGGTVRFITPTPSLTTYSVYAKGQVSATKYGSESWQAGIAAGGPIVQDKLGFRVSAFNTHAGGWIDDVDPYNGPGGAPPPLRVYSKDSNYQNTHAFRGVLLWRPTERLSVELSGYSARDYSNDTDSMTLPLNMTNAEVLADLKARGWTPPANFGNVTPYCINFNGVPGNGSSRTPVSCAGPHTHQYPAHVFGPYPLKKYQYLSVAGPYETNPFRSMQDTYALELSYDFDHMRFQSITSYVHDQEKTITYGGSVVSQLYNGWPPLLPEDPNFMINGNFHSGTKRHGLSQEFRFSSDSSSRPLSWVGGVYYSNFHGFGTYENFVSADEIYGEILGLTVTQRTGVPTIPGGSFAHRDQTLVDIELAGFGEANYYITPKLKAIAGVRISRVEFDYHQAYYGPLNGFNTPTAENGALTDGTVVDSPITPRFGLQYQMTENDQVYVSAAKGYRAGGVNSPLPPLICGAALTQLGLTIRDIPTAFGSDSIWSYELGTKLRLLQNRVALNADVYDIEWTDLQQTIRLGFNCGPTFVTNVGKARSRGFELETQARPFDGMTIDFAMSYGDAKVAEDALGPKPLSGAAPSTVALKGQPLGVPTWTFHVGGTYNFRVGGLDSYVRADYTLIPAYDTERSTVGVPTYTPDLARRDKFQTTNIRVGVNVHAWDVNLFVNNLFNTVGGTPGGGRTGCRPATDAACTAFSSYTPIQNVNTIRPREIGVQAVFRYH
jgi:outer membrane receptor protein involved in Fe transport